MSDCKKSLSPAELADIAAAAGAAEIEIDGDEIIVVHSAWIPATPPVFCTGPSAP